MKPKLLFALLGFTSMGIGVAIMDISLSSKLIVNGLLCMILSMGLVEEKGN